MSTASKRLKNARRQRVKIASQLRALKTGALSLTDVLQDPPDALKRVSVWTLMTHSHKLGPDGAKKVLVHAKVWPEDRLGSLDKDARQRIIQHLPPRVKGAQ